RTFYATNPYNFEMLSALPSGPSTPAYTSGGWYAMTGSGFLQWINTTTCASNASLWLTNVTAVSVSNSVTNTFTHAGGFNNYQYEVFATASLAPSDPTYGWAWMG